MWGEGRVPAWIDHAQGLSRSCYRLHMGKQMFSMGMDDGTTIRAYVDEDLRHQAYHRVG